MTRNPLIKRYLDAGMAFTQMTQAKAEEIVQDLVRAGEVQAQKAEELAAEIIERSNENIERLLTVVRDEVEAQLSRLGVVGDRERDDSDSNATDDSAASTAAAADAVKGPVKKPAKKSGARKTVAKKAASKKAASKKAASKKTGAKKAGAKKSAKKSAN